MAATRCDNCNTFCSLEEGEPEVQSWDFETEGGHLEAEIRLARLSECCAEEKKEAFFSISEDFECPDCDEEDQEFEEVDEPEFEVMEKGGGRYAKRLFWLEASIDVKCVHCERSVEYTVKTNEVAASEFDEL